MPLTKRAVSPVTISRNVIPSMIKKDELQCTANGSIANLILQLSSLSKHAENIFGEIYHDAMIIHHKTNTLQQRIDRLQTKVTQLDPGNDQVNLNVPLIKAFKSSMLVDQHILDRSTLPPALAERYSRCDQPPDLDALNPYRESDVPALSLYTNPSFFFDLWKKETLKEVAERPKRVKSPGDGSKSPKKRRKPPQQQGNAPGIRQNNGNAQYVDETGRQRTNRYPSSSRMQQQNEVFSFPEEYQAPQALGLQLNFKNQHNHPSQSHNIMAPLGMSIHSHSGHPTSDRILASSSSQFHSGIRPMAHGLSSSAMNRGSPSMKRENGDGKINVTSLDHLPPPDMSILSIDDDDDELPPPPPPLMHSSIVHQLPVEQPTAIQLVEPSAEPANIPPPPPPPPPVPANLQKPSAAATFSSARTNILETESSSAIGTGSPIERNTDPRGDLLAQIQSGIKLKKVRLAEESAAEKAALETNDVAAILKRRMDQVLGNDDSSSEECAEDDEWDD